MRPSYQGFPPSARPLAPILELNDAGVHSPHPLASPRASPVRSPVMIWRDDDEDEGASTVKGHKELLLPRSAAPPMATVPAVWCSISSVVSQLRTMQCQISSSAAVLRVMSAISTEAMEVMEAKRSIKADMVRSRNLSSELGSSVTRVQLGNKLSDLCRQVAALQELLLSSSDRPPEEEQVMKILGQLKVSRIKSMATMAMASSLSKPPAEKGIKSARGLPSLQLRRKEPKKNPEDSLEEGGKVDADGQPPTVTATLEQLEQRALQYSKSFSAAALMRAGSRRSSLAPVGIPSLPMRRRAPLAAALPLSLTPEDQEQVLARALQYSGSFTAIALRHATQQASFLRLSPTSSSGAPRRAPIGIPSLPNPQQRKMKTRRRAQAQIDEAMWRASCDVLT